MRDNDILEAMARSYFDYDHGGNPSIPFDEIQASEVKYHYGAAHCFLKTISDLGLKIIKKEVTT